MSPDFSTEVKVEFSGFLGRQKVGTLIQPNGKQLMTLRGTSTVYDALQVRCHCIPKCFDVWLVQWVHRQRHAC